MGGWEGGESADITQPAYLNESLIMFLQLVYLFTMATTSWALHYSPWGEPQAGVCKITCFLISNKVVRHGIQEMTNLKYHDQL